MLETKIRNLIDKHQSQADQNHRIAEEYWLNGNKEEAIKWEKASHPHESIALELRLALK